MSSCGYVATYQRGCRCAECRRAAADARARVRASHRQTNETPPTDWMAQAACVGHPIELWFADEGFSSYREARAICATCPVRLPCLDWAVTTQNNHGLWGGLNPTERRRIRTRRDE